MYRTNFVVGFSLAVMLLAGCGGDSSSPNQAPVLAAIADQAIEANEASPAINGTVSDRRVGNTQIAATSDNPAVLADAGIVVTQNRGNFSIVLTPVADTTGVATVTVTATDRGGLTDQTIFAVNVVQQQNVSFRDYFRTAFADDPNAAPRDVNTRQFDNDAQDDDYSDLLN